MGDYFIGILYSGEDGGYLADMPNGTSSADKSTFVITLQFFWRDLI